MLRVALLGQYDVHLDAAPVDLTLRPVQLLLAYLVLNRNRSHQREQLAGVLWPGYAEASARKNLRNTIHRLRKRIGDDYVLVDRASVAFNTSAGYWLDVEQLEQLAASQQIESLLAASQTYQGELLPGFYDDWIVWERERLQATFDQLMATLVARLNEDGRWDESIKWAEHWIAQGQVPEPAYRALMQAHAAQGDQTAMVQAYRRAQKALAEQLDVPPAADTERLYQALLAGFREEPAKIQPAAEADTDLPHSRARTRLPLQDTTFVGRQREIVQLCDILCQLDGGRLLTIVGPGGIGKTRLALETAAAAADHFADGVYFVPLAPVTDVQHLAVTIGDSLEYRSSGGDPRQGLLNYLARKQLLLVMDNFEHLLSGVDLVTDILRQAPRVRFLCTSRERLNLSGETLYSLSGLEYPGPDQRHANEEIAQLGAVQLLIDRARLARPGLETTGPELVQAGRICRLVQGMPLALVLAAGWLEVLTFEQLADEIARSLDILEGQVRDLPERQRSMRAAFEYSWTRLAAEEQAVYSRLAVFRGGFTRRAAQDVAGAGLRQLRTLVEKSLITAEGPDRYAVHELLRQFAEGKLETAGQADRIRDVHSRYYLEALDEREIDLKGRRQLEAMREIEVDLDNVRAAWDRALEVGNWPEIDVALTSISLYCYIRSRNQEGWSMFRRALARLEAFEAAGSADAAAVPASPTLTAEEREHFWARLVTRAGLLQAQFAASDPDTERELQHSLAIAEDLDDRPQIAHACLALGHYYSKASVDYPLAVDYFTRSLACYRALGDDFFVAHLLHRVGYALEDNVGLETFVSYTLESLELARRIGDWSDAANALGNLGSTGFATGDYLGAEAYLNEALTLYKKMPDREGKAHDSIQLALLKFLTGRNDLARALAAEGYALAREIVSWTSTAYGLAVLSILATVVGDDSQKGQQLATESQQRVSNVFGHFLAHWSHAAALVGLGQSHRALIQLQAGLRIGSDGHWYGVMTWTLPVFAIIYAQEDQPRRATELLGLYFNHPLRPVGWAEGWSLLSETQAQLQTALGREGYEAAWESGRQLDLAETVGRLLKAEL